MYTHYFGLKEKPFSIVPNPRFLYMSEQHREALAHLHYGIQEGEGFVLITGEVGAGKTTLCKCLLNRIPEETNVAYIFNSKVNSQELLASICDELKINYKPGTGSKDLIDKIYDYLLKAHANKKNTVLIIDEAQNLQADVLEQIRLLTNLETSEKKLLQIILIGQPELRDIFQRLDLRQLAQRVTARYHLGSLRKEEVPLYINHRITVAGGHPPLFTASSLKKVFEYTSGIPRLINLLCDQALLAAYSENKNQVDKKTLKKAARETTDHIETKTTISEKAPDHDKAIIQFPGLKNILVSSSLTILLLIVGFNLFTSLPFDTKFTEISEIRQLLTKTPDNKQKTKINNAGLDTITIPGIPAKLSQPQVSIDSLSAPDNFSAQQTRIISYQSLLDLWNINTSELQDKSICLTANQNGLRCFISKGNLGTLKRLNRPATLRLFSPEGSEYYLTLESVNTEFATVNIARGTRKVSIADLENQWSGDFLLLWKAPENFELNSKEFSPASEQWLRSALSEANVLGNPELEGFTFIAPLEEQIKTFQKSQGLEPDGIAGERTMILLNTHLGAKVPTLIGDLN